jgi:hypothetical protein
MIQKRGDCKGECNRTNTPINSKGFCSDCQYMQIHGKSRQEVYSERRREKEKDKPIKYTSIQRKPLKTPKKRLKTKVNDQLKDERLEKRREQIRRDEETYEQVFNSKPHKCEECGEQLNDEFRDEEGQIVARWQYSHIITKKSEPRLRNNPKNFNRLCFLDHQKWEFEDRTTMRIYKPNQKIIEQLRQELNS